MKVWVAKFYICWDYDCLAHISAFSTKEKALKFAEETCKQHLQDYYGPIDELELYLKMSSRYDENGEEIGYECPGECACLIEELEIDKEVIEDV